MSRKINNEHESDIRKILLSKIDNLECEKCEELVKLTIQSGAEKFEDLKFVKKILEQCGLLTFVQIEKLLDPLYFVKKDAEESSNDFEQIFNNDEALTRRTSGEGMEDDPDPCGETVSSERTSAPLSSLSHLFSRFYGQLTVDIKAKSDEEEDMSSSVDPVEPPSEINSDEKTHSGKLSGCDISNETASKDIKFQQNEEMINSTIDDSSEQLIEKESYERNRPSVLVHMQKPYEETFAIISEEKEISESQDQTLEEMAVKEEASHSLEGSDDIVEAISSDESSSDQFDDAVEFLIEEPEIAQLAVTSEVIYSDSFSEEICPSGCDLTVFYQNLIEELKFDQYPNKFSFIDAIEIKSNKTLKSNKGLKIAQKILVADHSAYLESIEINDSSEYYHPMDVLYAIYNSCTPDVFSIIQKKLYLSRLALPFISPDPKTDKLNIQLDSLRSIIPEIDHDAKDVPQNLADISQPIISFLRISAFLRRSKSKLLSEFFKQHTFFHRDCTNGMSERKLTNGLVELTCNLPLNSGKGNIDRFFTMLNLRGNALHFVDQVKCLEEISSLIVIFINEEDLQNDKCLNFIKGFVNKNIAMIIAVNVSKSPMKVSCEKLKNVGIEQDSIITDFSRKAILNDAAWLQVMVYKIDNLLDKIKNKKLSDIAMVANVTLNVIQSLFQESNFNVDDVVKIIRREKPMHIRKHLLPLQCKPWSVIAELYRSAKSYRSLDIDTSEEGFEKKVKDQRRRQLELYQNDSRFIRKLIEEFDLSNVLQKCTMLREELNRISAENLSKFHVELVNKLEPSNGQTNSYVKENQIDTKLLNENMSQASFGFEHIVREFGQVYEAHFSENLLNIKAVSQLPSVAATLLLQGFPFEIMDGDNAFVPIDWVCAVFSELEIIIGNDKKLLIVTVVGIQSSGKSTMLNSMFGLQLAVSNGRCTKGVYCSLIPVDKDYSKLGCDYVIVIDTEGLRAPELGDQAKNRDNELATFAIGLGNITIFNIFGENYSEIQDILEIVIHAFININKANPKRPKPNCFFVHQNVNSQRAKNELWHQRLQLKSRLDKITEIVAKSENETEIREFSDVIAFKEENAFYVPHLWEGPIPMAFISDSYINTISGIRNFVLDNCQEITRLGSFKIKIRDFWKALLSQDFVFSFRNSEELWAFTDLDEKMTDLKWKAKVFCLKLKEKALVELKNSTEENLWKTREILEEKVEKECDNCEQKIDKELDNYIENHEQKKILIQWQNHNKISIKQFMKEEKNEIILALSKKSKLKENEFSNKKLMEGYETEFVKKARETAAALKKSKHINIDTEKSFNEIWQEAFRKLSETSEPSQDDRSWLYKTFREHMKSFCPKYFRKWTGAVKNFLKNNSGNKNSLVVKVDDLQAKENEKELKKKPSIMGEFAKEANSLCQEAESNINKNIQGLFGEDINEMHIQKIVFDELKTLFACDGKKFLFKENFRERFMWHILGKTSTIFEQIRREYRQQNDMRTQVQQSRELYFQLFKGAIDDKMSEELAADQVYSIVKSWFVGSLEKNLASLIFENVKNQHHCFQTKRTFLQEVLVRLVDADFSEYISFISQRQSYLLMAFNDIINSILNENTLNGKTFFQEVVDQKTKYYHSILEKAIETSCNHKYFNEVLSSLTSFLSSEIVITQSIEPLKTLKDKDISSFKDSLTERCKSFPVDLWDTISKLKKSIDSGRTGYLGGQTPAGLMAEILIGCKAECPFCGNICDFTCKDHSEDHRCTNHIPKGINGITYHGGNKLVTSICPADIEFSMNNRLYFVREDTKYLYKDYKKLYHNWDIPPDSSLQSSMYWKRFMAKYCKELVEHYKAEPTELPNDWKNITREEAIQSLSLI